MILQSKYIEDENGVKYAPVTTPNAVRWPDGSNLNDKLSSISYNDLTDKPTIPTVPDLSKGTTTGNGNAVTDISVSGHTITLTKDATFLTSHQDISGKEDKMVVEAVDSGTSLTAAVGNYYRFTYDVGTLDITLPTPTGSNTQSVLFFMTTGASPAVTFTSTGNTIYKNDGFAIDATTTYEINALWNGGAWVINAVKYTT